MLFISACSTVGTTITTRDGQIVEKSYESEQLEAYKTITTRQLEMYASIARDGRTEINCSGPCNIKIGTFDPTQIKQIDMPKTPTNGNDVAIATINTLGGIARDTIVPGIALVQGAKVLSTAFESVGSTYNNSFNDQSNRSRTDDSINGSYNPVDQSDNSDNSTNSSHNPVDQSDNSDNSVVDTITDNSVIYPGL